MNPEERFSRYRELQAYAGWGPGDAERVRALAERLEPYLPALVEDFYGEIERHPNARRAITGGQPQIDRLKGTLHRWLRELLTGSYDAGYVAKRWQVGWRHVEIGLDQVFTIAAMSRLRYGFIRALADSWDGPPSELGKTVGSLNKLLDLDLMIIEDAYQAEFNLRQQRAERLAAIGQFAGGIAHELRNPLNVIKTSVYYLLHARNPTPEKTSEHLRRIEHHVGAADGVITALSAFAKMPVPQMTPFEVRGCVQGAVEVNPPPEGIHVEWIMPRALPWALGDADQLRIVFSNLIRNAIDAMPEGGTLRFEGISFAGGIELRVSDTGTGVRPEDLPRLMEPLYSTKARGLGLGLALAKAILEKNKGSLEVTSEVGKGSTFTVRLLAQADEGACV